MVVLKEPKIEQPIHFCSAAKEVLMHYSLQEKKISAVPILGHYIEWPTEDKPNGRVAFVMPQCFEFSKIFENDNSNYNRKLWILSF